MNSNLSNDECVRIALDRLQRRLDLGMCFGCATLEVADHYGVDQAKIEALWIDALMETVKEFDK